MKNYVLAFRYNLKNVTDFNNVIKNFSDRDYVIKIIDIKWKDNFYIDNLPTIIEDIKLDNEIERLVIIANSRQLLFSWYRCYNDLADDFVYVIENDSNILQNDEYRNFFIELSSLQGIETEEVQGNVYINIKLTNYKIVNQLLLRNNNYRFFENIANFDYDKKKNKKKLNKSYLYKNKVYVLDPYLDVEDEVTISLEGSLSKDEVNMSVSTLVKHNYFFLYFLIEAFKQRDNLQTLSFLSTYFQRLSEDENKQLLFAELINYIQLPEIGFEEKVYFLSLSTILKIEDSAIVLKTFMKTLLQDDKYTLYHYPIVSSIMFFITNYNLQLYDDYYRDLKAEIEKLSYVLGGNSDINSPSEHKLCNVAIHVDQLMGLLHSPTKMMMDYARDLSKSHPEFRIKIFVDDNFYYRSNEIIIPHYFISKRSDQYTAEHQAYLSGYDIEIYYSDVSKSKGKRTVEMLAQIEEFAPDIIWTTSNTSLVIEKLYKGFPIIHMSHGGSYSTCSADVYLFFSSNEISENNIPYKDRIVEFSGGLNFPASKEHKHRKDYDVSEEDFVMITVGNRLDAEMSEDFIDEICKFLYRYNNTVWLVVGPHEISSFSLKYHDLQLNKQIICLEYESDLMGLYEICDVYINPVREGGGISVAWAMQQHIPVVTLDHPIDGGLIYVGLENAVGAEIRDYGSALEHLYADKTYRKQRGDEMYARIQEFSIDATIPPLYENMKLARKRFAKRNND